MNLQVGFDIVEAVILFLSIKGRINFQQLERYGKYSEQRYRMQFETPFDFIAFNSRLMKQHGSGHCIITYTSEVFTYTRKVVTYMWEVITYTREAITYT